MTVTPNDIYLRAAQILGWRTGTIASGSTTTSVLNGLINTTGDDSFYAGDRLLNLDAALEANKERLITSWADSTGTATVLTQASPTANSRYIVVPRQDYTLAEIRSAFEKALNQTPRTYRQVVPFLPLLRDYPLNVCDWLTGAGDIDAIYQTLAPLMLHNEDFALWNNGPSSAPDGYTLTGSNATVARVSGGIRSNYAAQVTASAGGLCRLTNSIPKPLVQWITRRTFPVYIDMRGAAWVSTSDANSVRVFVYDGTTYHYSDYIDNDGVPQFPTLSFTPSDTMTEFTWGVEVAANKSCIVHWAGLMQNTTSFDNAYQLKDAGSQAIPYSEYPIIHTVRNRGGVPTVEINPIPNTWGQLIVYVRRPFPAYFSDTDIYDDQYARVLTAGLCNFLLEAVKPEQDRVRYDRIRAEQSAIWTRMSSQITDTPVPAPPVRYDILGA